MKEYYHWSIKKDKYDYLQGFSFRGLHFKILKSIVLGITRGYYFVPVIFPSIRFGSNNILGFWVQFIFSQKLSLKHKTSHKTLTSLNTQKKKSKLSPSRSLSLGLTPTSLLRLSFQFSPPTRIFTPSFLYVKNQMQVSEIKPENTS